MSNELNSFQIEYNPEWFQAGYYVYVISVETSAGQKYFYVGQTGDRNHKSARSPFYRLMGHFSPYGLDSKGTDAQLAKALRDLIIKNTNNGLSTRVNIERAIANKTVSIKTHFSLLRQFCSNDTRNQHIEKRKFVEEVEQALINTFLDSGIRLFNNPDKIGKKEVNNNEALTLAKEIYQSIKP